MQLVYEIENYKPTIQKLYLALGNFDGVHRGHQSLIKGAVERKNESDGISAAFIFEPHPAQLLTPDRMPLLLSTPQRKAWLLENMGLDLLIYNRFTHDIASLSPEQFVRRFLLEQLHVKEVFVGFNFSFGFKGLGTPETLKQLGEQYNFAVHIIEPVTAEGELVSSSAIRQALEEGKISQAARMLGYDPILDGIVVEGEHRGRQLGFPTANVGVEINYNIPAKGVYVARAEINDKKYGAVVNIGSKPTFHEEYPVSVEAHLLDFAGDIYGQPISLSFIEKIRDEKRFAGLDELVAQIKKDAQTARDILK
jgi:riboflavin kinase/FMN adenylyltransferase